MSPTPRSRVRKTGQRSLADALRRKIGTLPGVTEAPLDLGHLTVPRAYWVGGNEFVHFHGESQIDLRIPDDRLRRELLRDPRAGINPHARSRVEFDFRTSQDVADAFRIVRQVYEGFTDTSGKKPRAP